MVRASHWSLEGYRLYTYVTFTHHLSPCSSMVRASHWSSEGYRLYTYVTFIYHLSPCSSMVRASHWSSEGYRLYTYVTFTHHLSPCSSMVRALPMPLLSHSVTFLLFIISWVHVARWLKHHTDWKWFSIFKRVSYHPSDLCVQRQKRPPRDLSWSKAHPSTTLRRSLSESCACSYRRCGASRRSPIVVCVTWRAAGAGGF